MSDIGDAIQEMREGGKVARACWDKETWLQLQKPDKKSKMTLPYIYMRTGQGVLIPWVCSQTDLLTDDWEGVD